MRDLVVIACWGPPVRRGREGCKVWLVVIEGVTRSQNELYGRTEEVFCVLRWVVGSVLRKVGHAKQADDWRRYLRKGLALVYIPSRGWR